MNKVDLTTIHSSEKEDIYNKLVDRIEKDKKNILYLKMIIQYFEENNIERYKKFDKRDLTKIQTYFKDFIYYNHCQDNFGIYLHETDYTKTLYLCINNENQYNSDIEVFYRHIDGTIDFNEVKTIAKNRLDYIETKLKENKNILKHFDKYIDKYNKMIFDFYKFKENTSIDNIIDMYIYCSEEVKAKYEKKGF